MTVSVDDLRGLFLFEKLDKEKLEWLAERGKERTFPADDFVIREGDPAAELFVLIDGEVVMSTDTGSGIVEMNRTSHPGVYAGAFNAYLGDRAPDTYTHSLRTTAPSRFFVLPAPDFAHLVDEWFPLARHLLDGLTFGARASQELVGRRQRLVALGTITAGLTHELNNPAAAAARAVGELRNSIRDSRRHLAELASSGLESQHIEELLEDQQRCADDPACVPLRSPLEVSDAEDELGDLLEEKGLTDGWELAPSLVAGGIDAARIDRVSETVGAEHLDVALRWLTAATEISQMLDEVTDATGRISKLLADAKQYSQMDRAPHQTIDVHTLLDSTLAMLRGKIPPDVTVVTDYDRTLPPVPAYAAELNQVWTNLIVNAIQAMDGDGTLTLRTRRDHDTVVVDVEDTGPGVPEAVRERIFEPFFTTKPVGQGTGLGLDISFRIVAARHGGDLRLKESRPGFTQFEVRLPLTERQPQA
jgi:signal transduction histidine kinase